jgi:hypothetical protein
MKKPHTFKHDKYNKALKSLLALVKADLPQFMIYLIGVSRVGKTTLQKDLLKHLPSDWFEKVLRFEAPPKMTTQFTFKPFLLRYLEQLGDPFVEAMIRSYKRATNYELIELIVKRIEKKGIRLVIIDEADLFVTARGDAQAYENLQFLKSLVNVTGIPHIFAGTPELGEFLSMEGQVINRSHVITLAPYSGTNKTHVSIFLQALREFEKDLETPVCEKLKEDPVAIFKATNGCVGALKELLIRMDAMAIGHEQPTITSELIERFGFFDPDNVRQGEIEEFHSSNNNPVTDPLKNPSGPGKKKKGEWHKGNSRRKRHPGRRKPSSDQVGQDI